MLESTEQDCRTCSNARNQAIQQARVGEREQGLGVARTKTNVSNIFGISCPQSRLSKFAS